MATDRKPYCKIETSLLREPWPDDVKLALVRLVMLMCDRWARDRIMDPDEACRITLSRAQIAEVSGKHRPDVARTLLERLANVASISLELRGDFASIYWPKLAETQGWASHSRAKKARRLPVSAPAPAPAPAKVKRGATTPPPDPDLISQSDSTPTGANVNTSDTSSEPVAKSAKRTRRMGGTQCPEELTAEQWAKVEAWRIKKHPDIPAAALPKIWEEHALWYKSRLRPGLDWVRSFQLWILRDFKNPKAPTSATHRPPPPVWKAPQGPKFSEDPKGTAKALEENRKLRKKRRLTAEPKPPHAEEGGAF
jgi:hypothetical protein